MLGRRMERELVEVISIDFLKLNDFYFEIQMKATADPDCLYKSEKCSTFAESSRRRFSTEMEIAM